jgi:hypothetical protein
MVKVRQYPFRSLLKAGMTALNGGHIAGSPVARCGGGR